MARDARIWPRVCRGSRNSIRTNKFDNLHKYFWQFTQIYLTISTNKFDNLDKYIYQFGQMHLSIWTQIFCILDGLRCPDLDEGLPWKPDLRGLPFEQINFYNLNKSIRQYGQIHLSIWTNAYKFGQIYFAFWIASVCNLNKYILQFQYTFFCKYKQLNLDKFI